jgi:hypothetical protein
VLLRPQIASGVLAALLVGVGLGCSPPVRGAVPVSGAYFVGDSVMAWSVTTFRETLAKARPGIVVDVAACRGLVRSCAMPGSTVRPPSGLETIRALRGKLGDTVVIELGYNDEPLAWSIDHVMLELRSQGVRHVLWVNLSERRPVYHDTDLALDSAVGRWPEMRLLDWRTFSASHDDWFVDGVHLTGAGKAAFTQFVLAALAQVRP